MHAAILYFLAVTMVWEINYAMRAMVYIKRRNVHKHDAVHYNMSNTHRQYYLPPIIQRIAHTLPCL